MAISHTNSIGFAPSMNDAEHGVVVADRVAIPAEKGDAHLQLSAACTAEPRAGAIAIIGAGNAARSLACYLARQGYSSQLLVRSPHKVTALMERLRITSRGQLEGEFEISKVSDDIESTLNQCRTVFVATTTDAYREIAFRLAPHLTPDHEVILFSSKFAGAVEFKNVLSMAISDLPKIVETDAIFASRIQEDDSIWIRGIKKWTLYSSWNCTETERTAESILRFFPELGRADNIIQRGLTDFGALAHPITMIANMNSVDRNTGFLFYYEGFTEKTIILMERLEEEFCALAEAFNTSLIPMKELLNQYYGCNTKSLLEAMKTVPNYSVSKAPGTLAHRFIEEDVASSMVPMQQLARKARVKTPIIDSIINISAALLGRDFSTEGRSLAKLGWDHMSHEEILQSIHA